MGLASSGVSMELCRFGDADARSASRPALFSGVRLPARGVKRLRRPSVRIDMTEQGRSTAEAMFEKALDVAEKHLDAAVREGGPLGAYVAIAMIEAAVNQAVEHASNGDIADMLRDLAEQIENDGEDEED